MPKFPQIQLLDLSDAQLMLNLQGGGKKTQKTKKHSVVASDPFLSTPTSNLLSQKEIQVKSCPNERHELSSTIHQDADNGIYSKAWHLNAQMCSVRKSSENLSMPLVRKKCSAAIFHSGLQEFCWLLTASWTLLALVPELQQHKRICSSGTGEKDPRILGVHTFDAKWVDND